MSINIADFFSSELANNIAAYIEKHFEPEETAVFDGANSFDLFEHKCTRVGIGISDLEDGDEADIFEDCGGANAYEKDFGGSTEFAELFVSLEPIDSSDSVESLESIDLPEEPNQTTPHGFLSKRKFSKATSDNTTLRKASTSHPRKKQDKAELEVCASSSMPASVKRASTKYGAATSRLDEVLSQVDESFSQALMRMIDERNLTDPEVYRRANIDRKLFSKIRSNPQYQPKKNTALGLAIALHLNLDETLDFIGRAGYTLSKSSISDLVVMYFIENKHWDIHDINIALYNYDQALIGRQVGVG